MPAKHRGSWPKKSKKKGEQQCSILLTFGKLVFAPEEREFVVDSGASMHMINKKDLNSPEMDTLTEVL